jgi:hypothetical protein
MAEIITITVPELPFVPQVDGTEMIAVFKGERLQRIAQASLRGTKTFSGEQDPPQQPSVITDLRPIIGDRWRNTLTGDEWKVTSLVPFVWTPDGNLKGTSSTVPGPAGPPGKTGTNGARGPAGPGMRVIKEATTTIPLWTAVVADGPSGCRPADPQNPAHRQQVIGVTAFGGALSALIEGQNAGDVIGPKVGFVAGDTLFVGSGGALVPTAPASGWRQAVATVVEDGHLVINLGGAEVVTTLITSAAVNAVLIQALTDVVASLSLTPPDQPGVVWRNNSFVALSPNTDGTAYTTPYGAGLSGAVDPITAHLPILVPRALRAMPASPPAGAGVLWLNNRRLALSPSLDGTPYPVTPLPTSGSGLLPAVRAALVPWLTATMPALPLLSPISSGVLWRGTNLLSVS